MNPNLLAHQLQHRRQRPPAAAAIITLVPCTTATRAIARRPPLLTWRDNNSNNRFWWPGLITEFREDLIHSQSDLRNLYSYTYECIHAVLALINDSPIIGPIFLPRWRSTRPPLESAPALMPVLKTPPCAPPAPNPCAVLQAPLTDKSKSLRAAKITICNVRHSLASLLKTWHRNAWAMLGLWQQRPLDPSHPWSSWRSCRSPPKLTGVVMGGLHIVIDVICIALSRTYALARGRLLRDTSDKSWIGRQSLWPLSGARWRQIFPLADKCLCTISYMSSPAFLSSSCFRYPWFIRSHEVRKLPSSCHILFSARVRTESHDDAKYLVALTAQSIFRTTSSTTNTTRSAVP